MSDCIFCKIAGGEIKSDKVHEDDSFLAFRDIQPQAPTHIVVIPKKHVPTMNELTESDSELLSGLLLACQKIAKDEKLSERGYRIVINCNKDGGQLVFHLHAHLLGGRRMSWPPG
jgi:histidine triad (HIT) family protein